MTSYIIPIFVLFVIVFVSIKKVNVYSAFVEGAKGSIDLCFQILPNLIAIFIAIELLKHSGVLLNFAQILSPVLTFLGIPKELCTLILFKPLSGSGSISILSDIFSTYGVDSYISRCACAIVGSSETTFYVCTVYFSQCKIKKLLYAIPVSLISMLIGAVAGCFFCRFLWLNCKNKNLSYAPIIVFLPTKNLQEFGEFFILLNCFVFSFW